jgi:hypothetical protein
MPCVALLAVAYTYRAMAFAHPAALAPSRNARTRFLRLGSTPIRDYPQMIWSSPTASNALRAHSINPSQSVSRHDCRVRQLPSFALLTGTGNRNDCSFKRHGSDAALKQWQAEKPDLFLKRAYEHTGLDSYPIRHQCKMTCLSD